MKHWLLVLTVLVGASCDKPPTAEESLAQAKQALAAGDQETLHKMRWRSFEAAASLADDPLVGDQALQYLESCGVMWGFAPTDAIAGLDPDFDRVKYWRDVYASHGASMRSFSGFDCRPGPKPEGMLRANSSRPIPGQE